MIRIKTYGERHYICTNTLLSADAAAILKFLLDRRYAKLNVKDISANLNMPIPLVSRYCDDLHNKALLGLSIDGNTKETYYFYNYNLPDGIEFGEHYNTYEEAKNAINEYNEDSWK